MAKPVINYRAKAIQDRVNNTTVYSPLVTDRNPSVDFDTVVERAIDRGLIPGLKTIAAKSVAEGVLKQVYEELKNARGVRFGNYFYARVYLDGKCDGSGKLPGANGVNVRLIKGPGFSLDADKFAFQNADSDLVPSVDFLISSANGAKRNALKESADVMVNGVKLVGDDTTTKVEFWAVDSSDLPTGDAPVATVTTFISDGPNALAFAYPANITVGQKYAAKVVRTTASGLATESIPVVVTVVE